MNKLISIQGYLKKEFDPDGAPSPITVRRWCMEGKIPAEKRGGTWFVVIDNKIQTTGNSLVDRVLCG